MAERALPRPHITVGADGSMQADAALQWAAGEAARRGLGLRIIHCRLPLPRHVPGSRRAAHAEALGILDRAEVRARGYAPGIEVTVVDSTDLAGAGLAGESETAAMLVVGSRGRGGFRSLLLGSVSLMVAAVGRCPVVVVPGDPPVEDIQRRGDVVLGVDLRDAADAAVEFAFDMAAAHPGAGLHAVHGWSPGVPAIGGGPVFDKEAAELAVTRELAEATAGWSEKYPQVEVTRTVAHATPAAALVGASAEAALTVVGRNTAGTSLGMRLGPVAHAVLLHADSPVAVVPY